MNATLQIKRDSQRMTMLFRDTTTGQLLATVDLPMLSIGDSISKGGLDSVPASCNVTIHAQRTDAPTQTERVTHLLQCHELPDQKLYPEEHERAVSDVLRPYEVEGWKAVPGQLGNRNRIKRSLPGGGFMYEVDFVRHTFDAPAPAEQESFSGSDR